MVKFQQRDSPGFRLQSRYGERFVKNRLSGWEPNRGAPLAGVAAG
jgi:hypothetical protein